jgi:WD40 repeat protein
MSNSPLTPADALPGDLGELIARCRELPLPPLVDALRADQARRWRAGQRLWAETYLGAFPALAASAEDALVLIWGEVLLRRELGEAPHPLEYQERFPQYADALALQFDLQCQLDQPPDAPTIPAPASAGEARRALPQVPGYEVLGELGRGGMGVVYKARHVALDRLVALKMVLSGEFTGDQERARFRAESLAVARLSHANVVQIFEVGEHDGRPFFSMEFCGGGSLADRLDGTPWPPLRGAELVATLARAVHSAHQAGVVHRDLKPANVLLTEDGALKVGDFRLAKRLGAAGQTQSGAVVGTPSYMAPEQAQGQKEVGPAADVYALGAILYELLTGRPPFRAATPLETVLQVVSEEPVPPRRLQPGVPRDLDTICLKCLAKEPRQRYGRAVDLADDLQRFQAGQPIRARPVAWPERLWRACRRSPVVAGLTAALVLLLVAAAVVGMVAAFHFASLAEQARRSQTAAEENAGKSRRRLVQQYVATGERLAEEGDFCSALAWLAEALDLDRGDPDRERNHRIALRSLLRQMPPLLDIFALPELSNPARAASSDGKFLLVVNDAGAARVWDAESHRPLLPLSRAGVVRFAAFDRTGQLVLMVNARHVVQVWEVTTGRPVGRALKVGRRVTDAVLSRDGARVVTLTEGGEAQLWNGETGQPLPGPNRHPGIVKHIDLSPDGRLVVTAGLDRTARLWKSATGEPATPKPLAHLYPLWHASFSPDSTRLATASHEWLKGGQVRLYSCATGEPLRPPVPTGYSTRVLFSPDGKQDLTVILQVAALGLLAGSKQPAQLRHRGFIDLAGFSPDGRLAFTTTWNRTARLWEMPGGSLRTAVLRHGVLIWHTGVSRDGRRWRTASQDGVVRTWATSSRGPDRTMRHNRAMRLALSPDGRRLATGGSDRMVRLWDLDSGREWPPMAHPAPINHVAFSPDGGLIVTLCEDGAARVWDGRAAEAVTGKLRVGTGKDLHVPWAVFSHDSRWVVTAAVAGEGARGRGEVQVFEARTGRPVSGPLRHAGIVYRVDVSPDGRHLVTGSSRGACVWDLVKGTKRFELGQDDSGGSLGACSPDGTRILTAGRNGIVQVWNAETGRPISPPIPVGGLWTVTFSPDGGRVLTGGEDQTARVWDAQTGEPVTPPMRHQSRVADASFSADGRFVVTGSVEGGRVWDAATGRLLTVPVLPAPRGGWGRAVLSRDNRRLITADHDAFVRVWEDVLSPGKEPVEELILRARLTAGHRVGPGGSLVPLTPAELQQAWATLHAGGVLRRAAPNGRSKP